MIWIIYKSVSMDSRKKKLSVAIGGDNTVYIRKYHDIGEFDQVSFCMERAIRMSREILKHAKRRGFIQHEAEGDVQ
jgi:hypothetical protein